MTTCGTPNGTAACDRKLGHSGAHSAKLDGGRVTYTDFGLLRAKALAAYEVRTCTGCDLPLDAAHEC